MSNSTNRFAVEPHEGAWRVFDTVERHVPHIDWGGPAFLAEGLTEVQARRSADRLEKFYATLSPPA